MCKFGAHRTTSTTKKWDSRGDMRAMAKMGRVSGFWRFLGKYLEHRSRSTEVGVPVERNLTAGTVDAMFGVSGSRLLAAGALL